MSKVTAKAALAVFTLGMNVLAALHPAIATAIYGRAKARRQARQAREAALASLQDRTITQVATESPLVYVYGRAKVGSKVVTVLRGGANDEYQYVVSWHAAHECQSIDEIYIAGKRIVINGVDANGNPFTDLDANGDIKTAGHPYVKTTRESYSTRFSGTTFTAPHTPIGMVTLVGANTSELQTSYVTVVANGNVITAPWDDNWSVSYQYNRTDSMVRIRTHLGAPGDSADQMLRDTFPDKWTTTSRLRGFCHTVIRLNLNQSEFQGGVPTIEPVIKGKKLFDFRNGTTAYSTNVALATYDYLTSEICNVDPADLPMAQFITAANVCDEQIPFTWRTVIAGSTQTITQNGPRYTINGSVNSDEDKRGAVERIVMAMAGEVVDTTWDIYAGKYVAPVMSLDVDKADGNGDVIGPIQITSGVSESESWNSVSGQYVSEEVKFVADDFPVYRNQTYLDADGGEVLTNIDFPFTDSAQRVHNLCRILTEDQRQSYTVRAEFSLKAWSVKFGQRVTLTSSVFGWDSKVFRVVNRRYVPLSGGVELTLKEDAPTIWDTADATTVDDTPNTDLPDPFAIDAPASLTCSSGTDELLIGQDGTIISRIRATWPQVQNALVLSIGQIQIEWRRIGSNVWQRTDVRGFETEAFLSPVEDRSVYTVRARAFNPEVNAYSDWTYSDSHQVLGKSEPPPNMENLSISGAILNWMEIDRAAVRDYAGAVFRFHYGNNQDWNSAIQLHKGVVTNAPFEMLTRPAGLVTIMGRHQDTSGNDSSAAAVIVSNLGDIPVANVVEEFDFKAGGFAGTLSGCTVMSGDLVADSLDSFYGTGNQSFYGADNDPFYEAGSFAQMVYTTDEISIISALAGSLMTIEHVVDGVDLLIEYRFAGPDSAYGPDSDSAYGPDSEPFYGPPGTWVAWPGQIVAKNDVYQFRVTIGAGVTQGQITALKLIVDAPDIVEYLEDVPISAAGTLIPYTKNFSYIKTITATLQANASGAETIETNKTSNLAPTSKAYNSGHVAVSGATADFIIKGR